MAKIGALLGVVGTFVFFGIAIVLASKSNIGSAAICVLIALGALALAVHNAQSETSAEES